MQNILKSQLNSAFAVRSKLNGKINDAGITSLHCNRLSLITADDLKDQV